MTDAEVMGVVQAASQQLVADLERAAKQTGDWGDQELALALVDAAMSRCLARLVDTGRWGRDNQLPSSLLWQGAGAWLQRGSLQHHAQAKPRGYAGDHQLLTRIWERDVCQDPLGRIFDRYFQRQTAADVVRARIEQTAFALAEHCLQSLASPYRVLSIGSGPAIDVEQAVRMLPASRRSQVIVTLLDLDEEALTAAQQRLSGCLDAKQIVPLRENLFRLTATPRTAAILGSADFSVCTGLFDYLTDEHAQPLIRAMWDGLQPNGLMLVGNFAPHNPTRAYMEWIGNWYLLYRTPAEFRRLGLAAGLSAESFRIGAERHGVDLFLSARRSG